MRIAFTGAHRTGKSTLIEDLSEHLEQYRVTDEPYLLLEEDGYEFVHPPSLEDYLEQLRRSLELLQEEDTHVLLDRSPVDFLGYLMTHEDADAFDLEAWLPRIRLAVQALDFLVLVPIEGDDRIQLPRDEEPVLRAEVHQKLEWILLEDPFELGLAVLTVEGSRRARVSQVLRRIQEGSGS